MLVSADASPDSIVSENLQVLRFIPKASQRISHSAVLKISLKINEKALFKATVTNRPALDFGHIQIVVDKMRQHAVQRSAFVLRFG